MLPSSNNAARQNALWLWNLFSSFTNMKHHIDIISTLKSDLSFREQWVANSIRRKFYSKSSWNTSRVVKRRGNFYLMTLPNKIDVTVHFGSVHCVALQEGGLSFRPLNLKSSDKTFYWNTFHWQLLLLWKRTNLEIPKRNTIWRKTKPRDGSHQFTMM